MQPWHIVAENDSVTVQMAAEYTSTMDVAYRGSAVAIGAAAYNARIVAASRGVLGPVRFTEDDTDVPLRATITLGDGRDDALADLYGPMLARETNRHRGTPTPLSTATVTALEDAAQTEGGVLRLLTERADIERAAAILAATDRIRYLQPRLHAEMISELRWPDEDVSDGLDIRGLELDPADIATLDILRRGDVMARLAQWDAGHALGEDVTKRVLGSSGLGVVTMAGHTLTDYARGGAAVEAVWIAAQLHGIGIQPVSPVFLYAHDDGDLAELAAQHVPELRSLQQQFRDLTGTEPGEGQALVLRFIHAPGPRCAAAAGRSRASCPDDRTAPPRHPRHRRRDDADGGHLGNVGRGEPGGARRTGGDLRRGRELPAIQRPFDPGDQAGGRVAGRPEVPDPDPLGVVYFADADPIFAAAEHAKEPVFFSPNRWRKTPTTTSAASPKPATHCPRWRRCRCCPVTSRPGRWDSSSSASRTGHPKNSTRSRQLLRCSLKFRPGWLPRTSCVTSPSTTISPA